MKKLKEKLKYGKRGITLIALVITIIVLLILAGVTIATLTGDNGILTRAQEAKNKTEEASDIEKIRLAIAEAQIGEKRYQELEQNNLQKAINSQFEERNVVVSDNGNETFTVSCLDTLKDYIISGNEVKEGIDWNEVMENAVAPESQNEERNEGVIGIGTDGKPVDMDLWKYMLLDDGTFILNDSEEPTEAGYVGTFNENGEIIGTIPKYISINQGKTYMEVTSLYSLFKGCSDLKKAPIIPNTVTNMALTFSHTQIDISPILPPKLNVLSWTFEFTNLTETPIIPQEVQRMYGTFYMCKKLVKISTPSLPDSVTIIDYLFAGCENLILNDFVIDENIESMEHLFENCYSLMGTLIINANPTNYYYCFYRCSTNSSSDLILSGNSNILLDIFNTKIENSKIVLK